MLREYGLDNKYVTTDNDTVYQLLSKRALERPDELIAQFKDPQTNQWVDVMAGEMLAQVRHQRTVLWNRQRDRGGPGSRAVRPRTSVHDRNAYRGHYPCRRAP